MKSATRHWALSCLTLFLALAVLGAGPVRAASQLTVTVDPPNFGVNEAAELTITLMGDDDAVPIIPRVPGLVINPDGNSVSIQTINGVSKTIFSRTYQVTASHEGTFTIPPIPVGNARTAATTVHVGAIGQASHPGGARNLPGTNRAPAVDVAAAVRAAMPTMQVVLPKSRLYVGELIPIQIKAYFRRGIQAQPEGTLTQVGDAFTMSGLDKQPTQTLEAVGGVAYEVLTWHAVLGALKSGEYPLGLEFPLTLNVQLPGGDPDMQARLRLLFGTSSPNAFMDDSDDFDSLFGRTIQKSVVLKPDPTSVTVLPLPVEGRPADFSGAVGQFQVASELTPATGVVGDPLAFKLTVTGKGNLSRVSTDMLHDSSQWRVYRTDSKVTADDDSGLQGFKTFSQPVVPLQAGELSLPAQSFSYFDPEAGRYVTRATQPIRVQVTPGAGSAQGVATLQAGNVPGGAQGASGDSLAPDVIVRGSYSASLEPLLWRPWFLGSAVAPLLLMLAGVTLIRRHQLRSSDPDLALHAARLAAVKINLESMSAALNRDDAPAFFTAARHALQERLADLWQVPAESVDSQLLAARLPQQDGEPLQAIFAMAEKATYAGESLGGQALRQWHQRVLQQMDRLDAVK